MCGIAGFIKSKHKVKFDEIKRGILESIKQRGPNSDGFWNNNYISLVHSRLSILDTSNRAHQPMLSENERYAISYNGEIYNYLEIRKLLLTILKQKIVNIFYLTMIKFLLEIIK